MSQGTYPCLGNFIISRDRSRLSRESSVEFNAYLCPIFKTKDFQLVQKVVGKTDKSYFQKNSVSSLFFYLTGK